MPYTTTGRFAIVIFEHSAKIVLTVYLCRASLLTLARAEHRKVTVLRRYDARMWCVSSRKNQSMPVECQQFLLTFSPHDKQVCDGDLLQQTWQNRGRDQMLREVSTGRGCSLFRCRSRLVPAPCSLFQFTGNGFSHR